MSLPVSQYEDLLAEVRGLRRKAQRVQQLAAPLLHSLRTSNLHPNAKNAAGNSFHQLNTMDSLVLDRQVHTKDYERVASEGTCSDEEGHTSTQSASSEPIPDGPLGRAWPTDGTMWNSESAHVHLPHCSRSEMTSVMSFASSSGGAPLDRVFSSPTERAERSQQLEAKVDMVYSLLAMLGGQEHADMGETLLALSTNPESCLAMRQSGCIPLLVQLVESDRDPEGRARAAQALHNLVHSNPDEKTRKREVRVLKLLQQVEAYICMVQGNDDVDPELLPPAEDGDLHPVQAMAHLMKLSFDEGHRQAICQLGGIHSIAKLLENEHSKHGNTEESHCVLLRRYSCMALTNLTFGDSGNKALLCSCREFMKALVVQLQSPCDDLRQVTASVLRNLSWRADSSSKQTLREVGAVSGLMKAAMLQNKENTLKSILSALWNLSAHCTENKSDICMVEGALAFLVNLLTYSGPSKSLTIVENSGGILRNISSQIAIRDDFRAILRNHNCLQILLDQLKSPSLTVVSNACATLWNLSAKNEQDQDALWQMGAPAMLRSLNHSKHKMIAMGSSAALKNLLASRPSHSLLPQMDSTARAMDLPLLPTLGARKQRALMKELDANLSETCENMDSPTKVREDKFFVEDTNDHDCLNKTRNQVFRSESQECVPHPKIAFEARTSRSDTSLRANLLTEGVAKSRFAILPTFVKNKTITNETSSEKDHCSLDDIDFNLDVVDLDDEPTTGLKPDISMENIIERIQGMPSKAEKDFLTDSQTAISAEAEFQFCLETTNETNTVQTEPLVVTVKTTEEVKSNTPTKPTVRPTGSGIPLPRSIRQTTPPTYAKSTIAIKPFPRSSSTEYKNEFNDIVDGKENNEKENEVQIITSKPVGVATKQISIKPFEDHSDIKIKFEPWNNEESAKNEETNGDSRANKTENINDLDNCEEAFKLEKAVDNRMLDPDAMIESLDRFTAELVSQAEAAHSNKETHKTTGSISELGDTWNDDTSPNDVTFPSISGSAPNVVTFNDEPVVQEQKSNDFSSLNTTSSTMTESTLIAVEANKIATVLKNETMVQSLTSVNSLELDNVQPPSHFDSLTSSMTFDSRSAKASPKLPRRKRSLPIGLLARRALGNSLNQTGSTESVENSLSNLDQLNPPSIMGELDFLDMQASITSVASLPSEGNFPMKHTSHLSELENINPPSLFNEITDLCSSLADVPTEGICSEAEVYEDCITYVQTEDDVTLFSDAQNMTPVQSDFGSSSNESSPKKVKSITRGMTPKQKRKLAQERYKTYTVAAEMVTSGDFSTATDDFKTVDGASIYETIQNTDSSELSPKDIPKDSPSRSTPKERRRNNPERFQTQIIDKATALELRRQLSTPESSPAKHNTTRTNESNLSPDLSSTSNDFQFLKLEANRVLSKLEENKSHHDELLDCETLSLVSNDEESECNSGGSINYRTYTKSCGYKGNSLTRIRALVQASLFPTSPERRQIPPKSLPVPSPKVQSPVEEIKINAKPKIVIPQAEETCEVTEEVKSVRGKRKPLYTKTNLVNVRNTNTNVKPIRSITSNLVKNVTSTFKSNSPLRNVANKRIKEETVKTNETRILRPPGGYNTRPTSGSPKKQPVKQIPSRTSTNPWQSQAASPKRSQPFTPKGSPLERQGTFTKEETPKSTPTKPPSRIARAISQTNSSMGRTVNRVQNAVSGSAHFFGRSASADSTYKRTSASSQSLKSQTGVKKSPDTQRSTSNTSIASAGSTSKKQVTSKIASLWKKVEEQKKQTPKKDSRVWIQPKQEQEPVRLRESKEGVVLRQHPGEESNDPTKRISRLGSFIVMEDGAQGQSDFKQCEVVT